MVRFTKFSARSIKPLAAEKFPPIHLGGVAGIHRPLFHPFHLRIQEGITKTIQANYKHKMKHQQHNRMPAKDHVNFTSDDGLVQVVTKVDGARRNPPHSYPIVCLRLRPAKGKRIQLINDGSGGLDVLLRHPEIASFLSTLNQADPKSCYHIPNIPAKPAGRKDYWDRINQKRWDKRNRNGN